MKISIITICYNSEKTIKETIESVLNQVICESDDLEYLIVDGDSNDSTLSIINSFEQNRINVVSEPDEGISDAFNKGIMRATGDVIGIINSDDFLMPGALQQVLNIFKDKKSKNVDVVYGNCLIFSDSINSGYIVKPSTDLDNLKYKFLLAHPSIFIKREAYFEYGLFNKEYKCAMDYELISRFYFKGARFLYLDETLSAFREGGISQFAFKTTIKEHRRIAVNNQGNFFQIESNLIKLKFRRIALGIVKKFKMEITYRKLFKKQECMEEITEKNKKNSI